MAPPLPSNVGPQGRLGIGMMVLRSFVPPIILIGLVLGSILAGYATPTEAAGVGAAGAILLGLLNLVLVPTFGFIWPFLRLCLLLPVSSVPSPSTSAIRH